jgi:hypothetical protein
VVTSLASLANAAERLLTSRTDPRPAAEEWGRKCAFALTSAMAFDDRKGDGWCTHLHDDTLMADQVDAFRGLYGHSGETVSPLHARRMRAFLQDRRSDRFGATATTRPTSAGPMRASTRSFASTSGATA